MFLASEKKTGDHWPQHPVDRADAVSRRFDMAAPPDPSTSTRAQAEEIARSVAAMTFELNLVGLNSADFLVSDDAVWLIEINPRPGATLDVFESNEAPLFARHVAACEGRRMPASSSFAVKAAETVYAPHEVAVREGLNWPDWAVDRPPPGTRFSAGDPVCTVLASGATVDLARACASERAREIIALVQEAGALSDVETISVNRRAAELTTALRRDAAMLNLGVARGPRGETLIDAGAKHRGGVDAGLRIAEICLGGLGEVRLAPG